MAGEDDKHLFFEDYPFYHKPEKQWDQGACLTGHESVYRENNSCSYRWQGYLRAKEDSKIYNAHSNNKFHIDGANFRYICKEAIERGDSNLLPATRTGQISKKTSKKKDGTTETTVKEKVKVKNFTTGGVPYANQVHHIVPSAELRNGIEEIADDSAELMEAMAKGLLKEKYNINCKFNMIILPVAWKNACEIGLPTHNGSHPDFSDGIRKEIQRAMKPYQKAADQKEEHKKIALQKIKKNLENISKTMHDKLVGDAMRRKILDQCSSEEIKINTIPKELYKRLF